MARSSGFSQPPSKLTYALKALVDLAIHQGIGPVTVATIAKRQGIPARYLEQLFNRLRREGVVVAERGPRGGYRLGRPARQIQVSQIVRCFGPLNGRPRARKDQTAGGPDPAAAVWKQVEKAVQATLEATTLETLVAQVRHKLPVDVTHSYTFHI